VLADGNEKLKIGTLRDRMADEVFRYRAADHDTLWISHQHGVPDGIYGCGKTGVPNTLMQHLPNIVGAAPVIEFGVPEFCTFDNMYRFEVYTLLRT